MGGEDEEQAKLLKQQQLQQEREENEKMEKMGKWLADNGLDSATAKKIKKGMFSSSFYYPLHVAVMQDDPETVSLLLENGADKELKNSKHLTPLAQAQNLNKKDKKKEKCAIVIKTLTA